jgi:hypothetical protein
MGLAQLQLLAMQGRQQQVAEQQQAQIVSGS